MTQQALGRNGFHIGRLAHAGNAKGVLPAHAFQKLPGAVGPLVVVFRLNGVDLVGFFALHEVRQKASLLRGVVKKQLF